MSMSPRQQVAQNIADTCIFGGLNESYGVSCERATDKKGKPHWSVLFAKARTLDGVVRVYSPGFIMITDPQVIAVFVAVARGDLSAYDVMSSPKGEAQIVASVEIDRRYQSKCEGGRWHPDDDFEEILDAVCDDLAGDYEDLL